MLDFFFDFAVQTLRDAHPRIDVTPPPDWRESVQCHCGQIARLEWTEHEGALKVFVCPAGHVTYRRVGTA